MTRILLGVLLLAFTNTSAQHPYQDRSLSVNDRVNDLLARMNLEEKVGQMTQYVGLKHMQGLSNTVQLDDIENNEAKREFYPGLTAFDVEEMIKKGQIGSFLLVKGVDEANYLQKIAQRSRLKIPLLIGEDAIHGHAIYEGATVFPTPIGLASTFDTALVKKIAKVTAQEMRSTGYHWTFSPNVDVARDARWGRVGETFGEDVWLVGEMGKAMVEGYQTSLTSTGVLACAKHFVAGSQPLRGLNFSPMDASERAMEEVWLPPYEKAIAAGCKTVMAAHHDLNGVPCHANAYLLRKVLREQWQFSGFVVSDWLDVSRLHTVHKIASTPADANHLAVNAGLDMNMHGPGFYEAVLEQVKDGIIPMQRIDEAVSAILTSKFELGLFENAIVDKDNVDLMSTEAQQLALAAARKSIVLLENKGDLLPLNISQYNQIFVTGPNANNQTLLGDWASAQPEDNVTTILEGLSENTNIDFYECGDHRNISDKDIEETSRRAADADISIIVIGDNSLRHHWNERTAGENSARADVRLFGRQLELVKAAHKSGKPVIVVLVTGRPTAIPWIKENIPGVVLAWEPGLFGGKAVADVIFGKHNPSGRLPISIPRSSGQLPVFYNHRPASYFREYNDEQTGPLYAFGYGLNYTEVIYSNLEIPQKIKEDQDINVSVTVKNNGEMPLEHTLLLFMRDEFASVTTPVKSLIGFQKITLQPNEEKVVKLTIPFESLSLLDQNLQRVVEQGTFKFMIEELEAICNYTKKQ